VGWGARRRLFDREFARVVARELPKVAHTAKLSMERKDTNPPAHPPAAAAGPAGGAVLSTKIMGLKARRCAALAHSIHRSDRPSSS
jgi:hypothetical protein